MIASMFASKPFCRTRGTTLLAIASLLVGSGCTGGETSERAEELASLRQQRFELVKRFGYIQSGIRQVQGAALDHPGVRAAQDSFYAEFRRFVQREDPEAVELLDRAVEVGGNVERLSGPVPLVPDTPVTAEDQQAVAGEVRTIERELRPYIDGALEDPAVQSVFAALQDSLVTQMTRLDPNAPETIRRMNETAEQIRQLDLRIAELQGGP